MRSRLQGDRWRVTALGVALCVLAAVFAFEAKLAWFSPVGTPSAQISSAKLQRADAPRQLAQALAAPTDLHEVPAPAMPALLLVLSVLIVAMLPAGRVVQARLKVSASPSFSPSLFRRPPPKY
jgi:hypothetical protein